ncbi:ATP-binding protein [Pseudoduganella sp. RAF53_2]|uniref:sensor histidine kinase n=1 Tax=unclassified Pseudoduganella TaxID=2637179 RepID=UPI003F9B0BE2
MATEFGKLDHKDTQDAEVRFGSLLESVPDAVIMANAHGRVVLANSQADMLFGYARGELQGKLLEELMPARFRAMHESHRNGYARQPSVRPMGAGRELYGLRKDGHEFPVEISLSPVATGQGTLIMSAIRDISERKRFEQALHEKNLELSRANQAKDRFLANMSHELRTPLNAVIGFTGTLLMQLPGPVNAEQEKQLRTVQSSARHLLSLINDLLDLTKIASGKVELHPEPVNCRAVIEELALVFRPQARQKGLVLQFRAPADPVTLRTDRRALQQILMNLMNNAIKFTDSGEVNVVLEKSMKHALISVTDTGVGIAQHHQDKLYQAFTQIDQGTTRQFEGTGLGLHLSQQLAGLLGGKISCSSQQGKGSIFVLSLPLE